MALRGNNAPHGETSIHCQGRPARPPTGERDQLCPRGRGMYKPPPSRATVKPASPSGRTTGTGPGDDSGHQLARGIDARGAEHVRTDDGPPPPEPAGGSTPGPAVGAADPTKSCRQLANPLVRWERTGRAWPLAPAPPPSARRCRTR